VARAEIFQSIEKSKISNSLVLASGELIYPTGKPSSGESHFNPASWVDTCDNSIHLGVRVERRINNHFFLNEICFLPVDFNGESLIVTGSSKPCLSPSLVPDEIEKDGSVGREDARFQYFDGRLFALYTDYYPKRAKGGETRLCCSEFKRSNGEWKIEKDFVVSPYDINNKNGGLIFPDQGKKGWLFHRPMGRLPQLGPWSIEAFPFDDVSQLENLSRLSYKEWQKQGNRKIIGPDVKNRETHVGLGPPPIFLRRRETGEEDWAIVNHVVHRENDGTLVYSTEARLATLSPSREEMIVHPKRVKLFEPDSSDYFFRGGERKRIVFSTGIVLIENGRFDNPSFKEPNLGKAKQILFISGGGDKQVVWHLVDFEVFAESLLSS